MDNKNHDDNGAGDVIAGLVIGAMTAYGLYKGIKEATRTPTLGEELGNMAGGVSDALGGKEGMKRGAQMGIFQFLQKWLG